MTSISVDIARAEAGEADVEWVDAIVLTDVFGVTGPAQLPCRPLRSRGHCNAAGQWNTSG